MELVKFLKILKENLALIIILGVISCVSALVFYKIKPVTYSVFFDINISQKGEDQTDDYQYDNYYSGQAIDIFTDSLEKWFGNPRIITESYQKAGVDLDSFSMRKRSKLVKARKTGPQYLEVNFKAVDRSQGEKIVNGLVAVLEKEIAALGEEKQVWFKIDAGTPLIVEEKWSIPLLATIAFLTGGIVGIFLSLFKNYLAFFRN